MDSSLLGRAYWLGYYSRSLKFQVVSAPPIKVIHFIYKIVSLFSLKSKGLACWPGKEPKKGSWLGWDVTFFILALVLYLLIFSVAEVGCPSSKSCLLELMGIC